MEHYGKPADLAHLMQQWINAILRQSKFLQQIDPLDGTYTPDTGNYSPAALVFMDFTWRLSGVRRVEKNVEWNVRPAASGIASYRLQLTPASTAEIKYASGNAELFLNGKLLFRTGSAIRLLTDLDGKLKRAIGISQAMTDAILWDKSGKKQTFSIAPNEWKVLAAGGYGSTNSN